MTALVLPTTAYAAPGDLDTSWDTDGIRFDPAMSGEAIAVQSDGKVVTGSRFNAGLFRYNADGTPDTSFDGDGFVATNQGVRDIVIQSDGKIVVAGGEGDFWVARFNSDGTPDTSFDTDGEAFADFGAFDEGFGVAFASGGRIVVAGESNGDFAVARFTSAGAPDTSFDTDGRQTVDFGSSDRAWDLVVQSNGRTVLTGDSNGDFALAGLTDAGALDATFGAGGLRTTDFGGFDRGFGSALMSDDRIIVAGHRDSDVFAVARYTASGSLDSSCDGDGTFETTFVAGFQEARDVAVQFNDRFVVTGVQGGNAATARFEPADCAPDTSFGGGDGQVVQPITEGNGAEAIAINHSTGRILVAASIAGEPPDQFVFAYLGDPPPDEPPPQDPPPEEQPPPDPCANDRTGPAVTIRSVQDRTLYRQSQSPSSVRVEASDASGLRTDPADPNRPISTQQVGLFTVTATATDNCNNQTTATFKYRVAGVPEIGLAGVRASCTASNFVATIRITADVSLTSVTARLNGRTIARGTKSRLSFKVNAKRLRAGRHRITIATRDRAGNRSTMTVSFARCVVVEPSFTG
jgi:uncharacterized delta-60 repeat protein